jgi:hypothetical protein
MACPAREDGAAWSRAASSLRTIFEMLKRQLLNDWE